MKFHGRISMLLIFGAVLSLNPAFAAQPPFYQGKNITFLINFSAGGPTDIEGRIVARGETKDVVAETGAKDLGGAFQLLIGGDADEDIAA